MCLPVGRDCDSWRNPVCDRRLHRMVRLETLLALITTAAVLGFLAGYAVRSFVSYQRRKYYNERH